MPKTNLSDIIKDPSKAFFKIVDYSSPKQQKKLKELKIKSEQRRSGVIIEKVCRCGRYKPVSTKGVIDDHCANCGGRKKQIILR